MSAPDLAVKAMWVAGVVVSMAVVLVVWEWSSPPTQQELDEAAAKQAKDAMRAQGRLPAKRMPEWERRLLAYWRLGETKRVNLYRE